MEYKYRFCGFPIGVAMLPRFAAIVSSTTSLRTLSTLPLMRNTISVNGTKVISATSFVITILLKKQSITRIAESPLILPAPLSRKCPSILNIPSD